jgi:hypothetical protein
VATLSIRADGPGVDRLGWLYPGHAISLAHIAATIADP